MRDDFDAYDELEKIRHHRRMARRKRYMRSKLMPFRWELVTLRVHGASIADLTIWLRQKKRMRVAASTVYRFLQTLPELQEAPDGEV